MEAIEGLWTTQELTQFVLIVLILLIMLYAVYLMNRKIRIIESELMSIKKDTSIISEELETIAPKLKQIASQGKHPPAS